MQFENSQTFLIKAEPVMTIQSRMTEEVDLEDQEYNQGLYEGAEDPMPLDVAIPQSGWWFSCRSCGGSTFLRTQHPYCRHCGFSQRTMESL